MYSSGQRAFSIRRKNTILRRFVLFGLNLISWHLIGQNLKSYEVPIEVRKTNEKLLDTEENKAAQPDELLEVGSDMAPDNSTKEYV